MHNREFTNLFNRYKETYREALLPGEELLYRKATTNMEKDVVLLLLFIQGIEAESAKLTTSATNIDLKTFREQTTQLNSLIAKLDKEAIPRNKPVENIKKELYEIETVLKELAKMMPPQAQQNVEDTGSENRLRMFTNLLRDGITAVNLIASTLPDEATVRKTNLKGRSLG